MRRKSDINLGRPLRILLFLGGLLFALFYLGNQAWLYYQTLATYPTGTVIADIDVTGLTSDEARQRITDAYAQPVMVTYFDEVVELSPADAGFTMDVDGMLAEAEERLIEISHWQRYAAFVLKRPLPDGAIDVRLRASHDPSTIPYLLGLVSNLLDDPAQPPQLLPSTGAVKVGEQGYVGSVEESVEPVTEAFYRPNQRSAEMVVTMEEPPNLNIDYLEAHLEDQLAAFGGIGSVYIMDLETGEEVKINSDLAVSGLSTVKIAIMLESLRAIDGLLGPDQAKLMEETAVFSGNYSANLLLDIVAGQNNAYLGVDILTESMKRLGLENTFIATPYEEPPRAGKTTYTTPANTQREITLDPDPAMQTTAEEMGQLLAMVYYCAQGGGALIAAYPDEITPNECQYMLDLMSLNVDGNLIRFGVPETTKVSHKHGWANNTHGDVGVVFSEGGDYVIVLYLYQAGDWLLADISFPLMWEMSRSVYNYFNPNDPYMASTRVRANKGAGQRAVDLTLLALEQGVALPTEAEE